MTYSCDQQNSAGVDNIAKLLSVNNSQLMEFMPLILGSKMSEELASSSFDAATIRRFLEVQFQSPVDVYPQCRLFRFLWNVYPPFIFLIGTVGNLLVFSVLLKHRLTKVSTYLYLTVLAFIDEFILTMGLLRRWIDRVGGIDIENKWNFWCQAVQFIGVSSSLISVWLIVVVTLERLIVIKLPLRASTYATVRKTKITLLILLLLSMGLSSHFFYTVALIERKSELVGGSGGNSTRKICEFKADYFTFAKVWTFVDATLYSCLPLSLMVAMNIIIGNCIYRAHKNRQMLILTTSDRYSKKKPKGRPQQQLSAASNTTEFQLHSEYEQRAKVHRPTAHNIACREAKQLTVMLMIVSGAFLITTTPLVSLKFYIKLSASQLNSGSQEDSSREQHLSNLELMDAVFEMLMYTNHAINFLLYCAFGNKFRRHVREFLRELFCKSSRVDHTVLDAQERRRLTIATKNNTTI